MNRPRLGIDTGGTFTDVVYHDQEGRVRTHKLLSTPDNPARAIAEGVDALGAHHAALVHGTTVATNALLERRGAHTGLIITAGFEDILTLRRQARPHLYAFELVESPHVVSRKHVFGCAERVGPDGEILRDLTQAHLQIIGDWVEEQDFQAVAVCLLHAYQNSAHERRLGAYLRTRFPDVHVSVSHEVHNEFREYERCSTTAINAFVGPVMAGYLSALKSISTQTLIMQSSGGLCSSNFASAFPVNTLLSGPAGGVVGAIQAARELGFERVLTLDIGGTSTDVCLIDGVPYARASAVIDGLAVEVPSLDIETVGAGGGSIAWVDQGGALKVGPRSAGALPGPVCYARGGGEVTVTDAQLVLGRIAAARFLGGAMDVDKNAATFALEQLADRLQMSTLDTALGVIRVVNASMVRALKVVSVERGIDPRDCTLVAFGGGGGLHACEVADALQIRRVLIPEHPGLLSAVGLLSARPTRILGRTLMGAWGECGMNRAVKLVRELVVEAGMGHDWSAEVELRMRYFGQSFELSVGLDLERDSVESVRRAFEEEHEKLYGYRAPHDVELVAVRVRLQANSPQVDVTVDGPEVNLAEHSDGAIWRANLPDHFVGPLVIAEPTATTFVPEGWAGRLQGRSLVLER